ncbi:MAG: hypothetical protein IT384_00680 [Deltaproteobacteria bacterium]|nr:hypothetical protein [Deltaproteobacteria bacterium]
MARSEALFLGLLLVPALARAAEAPSYAAPEGCPAADHFWRAVLERSARASQQSASALIQVTITATSSGFEGVLALRDEPSLPRRIESARCEDVMGALALAAALAIDRQPVPAPTPAPAARVPVAPVVRSAVPERPATAGATEWRLTIGAHATAQSGVVPTTALALPIFASLEHRSGASFRVSFLRAAGASQLANGRAAFTWTAGRIEASPLSVWLDDLGASPFALFEAGILAATAEGVENPVDEGRPWLAAGAGVRIQWRGLDPLVLEASGGATVPILRDRFFFAPGTTVHEVASIAAFGGGGASVAFF